MLSPKDRAELVEKILYSLDQPDPAIDTLWAQKAEDRINAYDAGELEAVTAEAVLKRHKKT
jgi:putative addiction module component (TIGR02574 family)